MPSLPSVLEIVVFSNDKNVSRLTSHQALRQCNEVIRRNNWRMSTQPPRRLVTLFGRTVICRIGSMLVNADCRSDRSECMIRS